MALAWVAQTWDWVDESLVLLKQGEIIAFYHQADPLISASVVCACLAVYSWVVSVITKNYSSVDRLWSVVPVGYIWHFTLKAGFTASPRHLAMALLTLTWGVRLSYNFWRKGGYSAVRTSFNGVCSFLDGCHFSPTSTLGWRGLSMGGVTEENVACDVPNLQRFLHRHLSAHSPDAHCAPRLRCAHRDPSTSSLEQPGRRCDWHLRILPPDRDNHRPAAMEFPNRKVPPAQR